MIALPADENFDKAREYLRTCWTAGAVNVHINNVVAAAPFAIPSPILWAVPNEIKNNLAILVRNLIADDKWLIEKWPIVKMLLGTNVPNLAWTSAVITTLALIDIIHSLPLLIKTYEYNIKQTGKSVVPASK